MAEQLEGDSVVVLVPQGIICVVQLNLSSVICYLLSVICVVQLKGDSVVLVPQGIICVASSAC